MYRFKTFVCPLCCALLLLAAAGCGKRGAVAAKIDRPAVESEERQFTGPSEGDSIAVFNTSLGEFRAVLYPDAAPMAVENFTELAKAGYYDGTIFYRAVPDFALCGGDATGTGTGGTTIWNGNGYPIEYSDSLHHYAGALCMAKDESEADAGVFSCFYVVTSLPGKVDDSAQSAMRDTGWREEVISAYAAAGGEPGLDYTDTVFGQIYSGMEVADAASRVETDDAGRPLEDIILNSITIETYSG